MKIPVSGDKPPKTPGSKPCGGTCRWCRAGDLMISRAYRETVVYGLGIETVRYLQYMARMTMLEADPPAPSGGVE